MTQQKQQPKEPHSIESIFLHSFALLKQTWLHTLPLTICLIVAILSPSFWLYDANRPVFFLGYFLLSSYIFSVLLYYMLSFHREAPVSLRQALWTCLKKLWIIVATGVLVILLTVIGYILLFVPGIIVTVWLSMCVPLILWDDANPLQAVRQSYELTTDEWWRTALIVFLPIALLTFIAMPLQEAIWHKLISLETYATIQKVLVIFICLGYVPWVASLITLQFDDLKRRQAIRKLRGTPMQFASNSR